MRKREVMETAREVQRKHDAHVVMKVIWRWRRHVRFVHFYYSRWRRALKVCFRAWWSIVITTKFFAAIQGRRKARSLRRAFHALHSNLEFESDRTTHLASLLLQWVESRVETAANTASCRSCGIRVNRVLLRFFRDTRWMTAYTRKQVRDGDRVLHLRALSRHRCVRRALRLWMAATQFSLWKSSRRDMVVAVARSTKLDSDEYASALHLRRRRRERGGGGGGARSGRGAKGEGERLCLLYTSFSWWHTRVVNQRRIASRVHTALLLHSGLRCLQCAVWKSMRDRIADNYANTTLVRACLTRWVQTVAELRHTSRTLGVMEGRESHSVGGVQRGRSAAASLPLSHLSAHSAAQLDYASQRERLEMGGRGEYNNSWHGASHVRDSAKAPSFTSSTPRQVYAGERLEQGSSYLGRDGTSSKGAPPSLPSSSPFSSSTLRESPPPRSMDRATSPIVFASLPTSYSALSPSPLSYFDSHAKERASRHPPSSHFAARTLPPLSPPQCGELDSPHPHPPPPLHEVVVRGRGGVEKEGVFHTVEDVPEELEDFFVL